MKRLHWVWLAAWVLAAGLCSVRAQETAEQPFDALITEAVVRAPLEHLASDAFNGRLAGSEDMARAAAYVAGQFKEMGLEPAGADGGFLQTFSQGRRDVDREKTSLALVPPGGERRSLRLDKTFVPFRFSAAGALDADVVFAGYGITAPENGYDDYAGLDVKGKVALIMRYEPGDKDAESPFNGLEHTQHATFEAKVANAEKHGAAGVLLFTGPHYHADQRDELYGYSAAARRESVDIPVLQIVTPEAEALLAVCGRKLADVQARIDEKNAPQSFAMAGVRAKAAVAFRRTETEMRNVVAVLPGADEKLADEAVVVGAHLDHIGARPSDPDKPDRDVIFNGADDNASGVAALLAIARAMTQGRAAPRRTIVFVAFDGEEVGLFGSRHYVAHPVRPLGKTAAMVNLDMVGRLRGDGLAVMGVGSGAGLKAVVDRAVAGLGLKVRYGQSAMAPADSMSFAMKRVPALFFHTGLHQDYHRVTDEASKINYVGLARVARAAARTVLAIADADEAPTYTATAMQPTRPRPGGPMLGVSAVPDDEGRLTVRQVVPGSGAEKAGILPGDVFVTVDGRTTVSLRDLVEIIGRRKVGERVKVVLRRGERDETVEVTLGARAAQN